MRANCLLMVATLALQPTASQAIGPIDPVSTTFQVDPAHDGAVTFSTPFNPPLRMRWSLDLGGPVSYPVVVGNLAIVIVGEAISTHLAAINTETGKIAWQKPVNGGTYNSYLASDGGKVFFTSLIAPLQAFDGATGKSLWSAQSSTQLYFGLVPVASNGYVFVAADGLGGTLYRIDEKDGAVLWSELFPDGGVGVTLGDSLLLTLPMACNLPGLNANTGKKFWDFMGGCGGYGSAIASYYRHRLYSADAYDGDGVILNTYNGKPVGSLSGAALAFFGNTFFSISGSSLVASNISTGNINWYYTPKNDVFSNPPIAINGYTYTLSNNGALYVNAASDGRLVQSINIGFGSLSNVVGAPSSGLGVASGVLLVPSGSKLTAFGP